MNCSGSATMYPRPLVVHTCVETVLDAQHYCSFSQINLQILSVLHSLGPGCNLGNLVRQQLPVEEMAVLDTRQNWHLYDKCNLSEP